MQVILLHLYKVGPLSFAQTEQSQALKSFLEQSLAALRVCALKLPTRGLYHQTLFFHLSASSIGPAGTVPFGLQIYADAPATLFLKLFLLELQEPESTVF